MDLFGKEDEQYKKVADSLIWPTHLSSTLILFNNNIELTIIDTKSKFAILFKYKQDWISY